LGKRAGLTYKSLGAAERGERHGSLKRLLKSAQALAVEPYELLVLEQEEASRPKLRTRIEGRGQEADRGELPLAYTRLKVLLRSGDWRW
jgi:transcriptional regulator with XRE-family HTH domain